jgi:hypothetical protein
MSRSRDPNSFSKLLSHFSLSDSPFFCSAFDYADESITLFYLRTRWEWDPLRNDSRFQKILAGPEPKTIQ